MTDDAEFMTRFQEVVATVTGAHRHRSPGELVKMWEQFVDLVEDGYEGSIYEYDNDLSVRNLIDAILDDDILRSYKELTWFREQIDNVDRRFRELLQSQPYVPSQDQAWWQIHAPRWAGAELAEDFSSNYGATVEVR